MKVVERYILRRAFAVFIAALTWTLAIVWTTQVLGRIDLVTDSGQSALTFFEVAALILPTVIPIVVPFAVIIAVALTLSTMNSDSELVILNAAGASRLTVIRPIIILAVCAAMFSFIVDNVANPMARQRNRELIATSRADLLSLIIQEGTFRKVDDGLFVQVGERLPNGGLGGIFVADSREPNVDLVYYAKDGSFIERNNKQMLVMNEGVIHRKAPGGEVSVISFDSYAFDLSEFSAAANEVTMQPKDRSTSYLMQPQHGDKFYQRNPRLFDAELNRRFSDWLYSIAFAFIALAVAGDARSHREARIHPLVTTVAIALFFRWLGFFANSKAEAFAWIGYVVYAIPIGASLFALWFIRNHRSMELPVSVADRMAAAAARLRDGFTAFRQRITGRASGQGAA
ncbi:LPS export ABC transporter permease LptF [Aminobacter sp. NyZ550]|uniref:Lipopolysaccharide export system permease protein n=1 Tax=Aminobacter ciceronei TaxID=150723 RepID=A0ABR6C7P3_9HYPH|nr:MULTISPECIES: LPS export ABC transporter permease LptF [Aminobacter]MBA8907189.1 lipopolysaccharide export system permease protein [Aminobacter ciceronei]MBA9021032.1 lipopolysaccharide export system permease protein [Aminobacter ciceronei]MRX33511.1 LPS export ABC transporter permease LptF [Aminobacter sp. MDW-2]QNH33437.1 LPS export ABC transporter permease LptF [Aminobacter sp. MDW-2]WAX94412.1 LPS export ABC transporter permease LptF [Aminobacter sp. NyZ550]